MNNSFNLILISSLILCVQSFNEDKTDEPRCQEDGECDCGGAARPSGTDTFVTSQKGSDNISIEEYKIADLSHNKHLTKLMYRCSDENDLLVGNNVRQCERGKWFGEVPRCAINLMNETQVKSIEILDLRKRVKSKTIHITNKYRNSVALMTPEEKQPNDCPKWKTMEQQIWVISLNTEKYIQYIRFKLYAENIQQVWNNREFVLNVFLDHIRGNDSIECEYQPLHSNQEDNSRNKINQNKNYLALEYGCELPNKKTPKNVNKLVVNFSYMKKFLKISTLSLCDLNVYDFDQTCGLPDYPLLMSVRKSERVDEKIIEEYAFSCSNDDLKLEGKSYIRCGNNGKWVDEFPQCLLKSYCQRLDHNNLGKEIIIDYEETITDYKGEIVIQDGKIAKVSCNNTLTNNQTEYKLHGISRLLCKDGKWFGYNSRERLECVLNDTNKIERASFTEVFIGILSILLFICIFLIVFLIIRNKQNKNKEIDDFNDKYDDINVGFEDDYEAIEDNEYQVVYEPRYIEPRPYHEYLALEDDCRYEEMDKQIKLTKVQESEYISKA